MEAYTETLNVVGESILQWFDPETKFRGFTQGWLMTDFPTAFNIVIAYLAFVFIGSAVMKSGALPAMDPYPIKFFYNVSQIIFCSYATIEAILLAYRNGYNVMPCNAYDTHKAPVANLLWMFYLSKAWDFWDTIFIVLGKKWRQLSFLHVYHHTTIFLFCWLNANVLYDGDIYLSVALNGFIHTVMYTYYFICMHTKDPKTGVSLPIWWKSSLTLLQLAQFVAMMSQGTYLLSSGCETCNRRVTAANVVYILSFFYLFTQFFVASYVTPKKDKKV